MQLDDAPVKLPSHSRFAAIAASVAIVIVAAAVWIVRFYAELSGAPYVVGMDARFYFERAESWLAGDGFYLSWQLTGRPYVVEQGAAMYPPTALLFLVPFALGMPVILWWAVPIAAVIAALVRLRPRPWAWPLLALVLLYPRTWVVVALGNPAMWIFAAVAAGLAWSWPSVFAFIKPTFAPLAILGIRHTSWWVALAGLVIVSLPFGAMWLDYARVLMYATSDRGVEYTLGEWPIALALLLAAAAGHRSDVDADAAPANAMGRLRKSGSG